MGIVFDEVVAEVLPEPTPPEPVRGQDGGARAPAPARQEPVAAWLRRLERRAARLHAD